MDLAVDRSLSRRKPFILKWPAGTYSVNSSFVMPYIVHIKKANGGIVEKE